MKVPSFLEEESLSAVPVNTVPAPVQTEQLCACLQTDALTPVVLSSLDL